MTIRWFVEVSPVDASALKERYCVEAMAWQQALQQARKLRGDRGPLARFAMELLEVGYRATDPTSRLRYTVSRAPAEAPTSVAPPAPVSAAPPAPRSVPPPAPVYVAPPVATIAPPAVNGVTQHDHASDPEIEELSNPVLLALPPPLESHYEDVLPTMPQASEIPPPPPSMDVRPSAPASRPASTDFRPSAPASGPASTDFRSSGPASGSAIRPSQIPLPRKARARNIPTSPAVPRPNRSHSPSGDAMGATGSAHVGGAAAPNLTPEPLEDPVPTLPGLTLLSQRREEPTESVPILYREYAMAFDANLSPRELERYARAIWEQVKTSLGHRAPGKFVQVALFDHKFSKKPERAPAAVLAWKDWRGDPVIRIRAEAKPPSIVPSPPEQDETAPAGPAAVAAATAHPVAPVPEPEPAVETVTEAATLAAPEAIAPDHALELAPDHDAPDHALELAPDHDAPAIAPTAPVIINAAPLEALPLPVPPALVGESDIRAAAAEASPLERSAAAPAAVAAEALPDPATEVVASSTEAEMIAAPAGSFPPPASASIPVLPPPVPPPLVDHVDAPPPDAIVAAPEPVAASAAVAPPSIAEPWAVPRAPAPSSPSKARMRAPTPRSSGNAVRRRGSSEDLIGELFEEMHQLHFMRDIVAGADYVLSCVLYMLPCEGVLIHVFDIDTREFVVVRAAGPSLKDALLVRTPDTYAFFREAFRRQTALNFPDAEIEPSFAESRWERLGVRVKSAMCGAVQHGGRYLGVIELANPLGGEPFRVTEVNALDYICEQFADFVASRPIVLDEDAVLPKA